MVVESVKGRSVTRGWNLEDYWRGERFGITKVANLRDKLKSDGDASLNIKDVCKGGWWDLVRITCVLAKWISDGSTSCICICELKNLFETIFRLEE